jgi:hypothetical protein
MFPTDADQGFGGFQISDLGKRTAEWGALTLCAALFGGWDAFPVGSRLTGWM